MPVPSSYEEVRDRLLPMFQRHPKFELVEEIWTARIPIVRFRFAGKVDVDLSCNNTEPLPNTQLLQAYALLGGAPLRHFVVLIKLWTKAEQICGAKYGHLSSYALTLMVIYFLQAELQLPCLPCWAFVGDNPAPQDSSSWVCPLPISVLIVRFFRFYTAQYQWGNEVVSIRTGQRFPLEDPIYNQLKGRSNPSMIHIEDPFLLGRNLNCVL